MFSRFFINKIIEKETPILNTKRCINNLQKRQHCNLCIKCCPQKALVIDNKIILDKSKCDNCSICSNVCPTGAWIPNIKKVEKNYYKICKLEDVSIGCSEEKYNADINVECIAELPWDFLAYIALENKVILSIRNCKSCKLENLIQEVNKNIKRLKNFLGEEKFNDNIVLVEDEGELPVKQVSRRELFMMLGDESKRLLSNAVPIDLLENKNGRIYRSALLNKINKNNIKDNFTWCGVSVNHNCYGCGICEKLCPNMAIKIKVDTKGNQMFNHDYTKCTHCGICTSICIEKAITLVNRKSNDLLTNDVFKIKSLFCSVCNDPIKEDDYGICIICKNKRKSRY